MSNEVEVFSINVVFPGRSKWLIFISALCITITYSVTSDLLIPSIIDLARLSDSSSELYFVGCILLFATCQALAVGNLYLLVNILKPINIYRSDAFVFRHCSMSITGALTGVLFAKLIGLHLFMSVFLGLFYGIFTTVILEFIVLYLKDN